MMHSGRLGALITSLVLASVVLVYCGSYKKILTRRSPTGKSEVALYSDPVFGHIMIDVVRDERSVTVFRSSDDVVVQFFETYWNADESVVAIFASGTNVIRMAVSVKEGREIPFQVIQADFADAIARRYGLKDGTDGLDWAILHRGVKNIVY